MLVRIAAFVLLTAVIAFVLPVTVHGDFTISMFNASLIITDRALFYQALADEATGVFPTGLSGGPYGPLFYYPTALWAGVLDLLGVVDINGWDSPNDAAFASFAELLALKLPNLIVYALVAVVLARTWRGERGETASWLWLANPAAVLFGLMMAQNDGWTALATTLALLFGLRAVEGTRYRVGSLDIAPAALAMLALAAGGAIKLSPVLLVLPAAWLLGHDARERLALAALGLGVFALLLAPFAGSEFFWDHGLFARQAGQQPEVPRWGLALVYAAFLAAVVAVSRRDGARARVLVATFLLLHALLYLLPPWSPQRSMLFVAMLAAAVPAGRAFVVPYLLVTAVGLVLALEHAQEIAAALFGPLSDRVLLIGPVSGSDLEPLTSVLYVLGGLAWLAAIAALWARAPVSFPSLRWPAPATVLLLPVGLGVYFGAAFAQLPDGVDATPYAKPAPPIEVRAGERLMLSFVSAADNLDGVSLRVVEGEADAGVRVLTLDGDVLYDETRSLAPGELSMAFARIEEARGEWLTLELAPDAPITLAAAELPPELVAGAAEIEGVPVEGAVPRYTLHHETTWAALRDDARSRLGDGWQVLVASGVVVGVIIAGTAWASRPRPPRYTAPE
jgi:hypothetical protein